MASQGPIRLSTLADVIRGDALAPHPALRMTAFPIVARASACAVAAAALAQSSIAIAAIAIWAALSVPTRGRLAIVGALGIVLAASSFGPAAAVLTGLAALAAIGLAPEACALDTNWMDRALLAQTYAGRPMTTHHVLESAAPFDRARLAAAVDALVRSTPALRSFVREAPLGVARFAAHERWGRDAMIYCDAPVDLGESGWFRRAFDLAREEPLRVLHAPRPDGGFHLVLTLHHSVTDGVGALALFDALLAHYAADEGSAPAPIAAGGAGLARMLVRRGPLSFVSSMRDGLGRIGRFADRRAAVLEQIDAPAQALRCAVIDLPAALWRRLRVRAAELGCTRNDLMLSAMLRASARWRRERGLPDEDFRALMPVDLRGELGIGASLSNHLSTAEPDFSVEEIDDPTLPKTVAARVKEERAPGRVLVTPIALVVLGTILPPFVARAFFRWIDERRRSFMYSFLFSHIRVPASLSVPPSVEMRRIYCLSALPRQPGIGLTITALPDAVTAALAYTPPRSSDEAAKELLTSFLEELEAL